MNKKVLATVLALGVIASVGYFGTTVVMADDTNPIHANLITKIAQKFNLKESDVQAVFDAVRDERQEEMKSQRTERLSQAVKDGVITEVQKQALLAKMEEHLGEKRANRAEMQKWFADNNIDETKLRDYLRPAGKDDGQGRGYGLGR